MASGRFQIVGYLRGVDADGSSTTVTVTKKGREYRIGHGFNDHLCHPSIRDIEAVKRETFLVYRIKDTVFEPA